MLRDAQGALEDFKAAIKLSPYTAHVYFNRGNLYASMGHFDKAEAAMPKGKMIYSWVNEFSYFLNLHAINVLLYRMKPRKHIHVKYC
jgi:tetratricopeptide (TPR) repeat protein